jgi:hypothetical protein
MRVLGDADIPGDSDCGHPVADGEGPRE